MTITNNITRTRDASGGGGGPVGPTGPFAERDTLLAGDAVASDFYGYGAALNSDGTILAVGSPNLSKVYIYDYDGSAWAQRGGILQGDDTVTNDFFGSGCALSDDGAVLAVGALDQGTDGAAYVFDWNGSAWVQRSKVVRGGGATNSDFGEDIALNSDGTILAVGGQAAGVVVVYDWNGSSYVVREELTGSTADEYGTAVALTGDGATLVVGAPKVDSGVGDSGAAYVYDWNGSAYIQRGAIVEAAGVAANANVGRSCGISSDGNTLILGSMGIGANGAAYEFTRNGSAWDENQTILASDGAPNDFFGMGSGLGSDGVVLAVGAPYHDGAAGANQGKMCIFERT